MVLGAVVPAALGFGSAIGAGAASYFGQRDVNKRNVQSVRE